MKSIFRSVRRHKPQPQSEVEQETNAPFFSKQAASSLTAPQQTGAFFQPKLSIGQPGDQYEREADTVADKVLSRQSGGSVEQATPAVQRLATPAEEKMPATNDERMAEDKRIQEKPDLQRAEAPQPEEEKPDVQKMEAPDHKEEEKPAVQKMEAPEKPEEEAPAVQKMDGEGDKEDDKPVQAKPAPASGQKASPRLSGRIESSRGRGHKLLESTRAQMESSFGRDFSDVTIHTDSSSVEMNRELGAQAFTHGSDVYFDSGKYQPESTEGKRLLAHELTHVVQQGHGDKKNDKKTFEHTGGRPMVQKQDQAHTAVSGIARAIGPIIKKWIQEIRFNQWWSNYPAGEAEEVKKQIGGKVNAGWIDNTCAIRISRVLNYSGFEIPYTQGETISGADGKWYFYRIRNLRPYLESKLGAPNYTFSPPYDMTEISKLKGFIHFDVKVWRDATGHFDLWNGNTCAHACYFDKASSISIWTA